ncbi:nicotinate-nucleotide adenylyltransferase [Fimbriiglobus ruber]|uniref:Probable nicotinate-nucleotide adenylyltransferase n=1 Tax=Fimbriiglobus ruber TaxID=1908690 RepID=A0A225DA19_9BACT|nr:nicotinate-nucleotide adenylyltransferase [Fimbriiglobus ruber]OWK38312.1 Nicotinate-nucleotide adenylyltransferase [Fimbriiglobus ruber]
MRVGIFGGAFDPVHTGHLVLAEQCREAAGLDEVWFLPSYKPPHKTDRELTRFEHRCEMVLLATTGQPAFRVEPIEKELPPPNYTSETLAELQERHPGHQFSLLLGADSLVDFPHWHEPKQIVARAELVVVARPGAEMQSVEQFAADLGVPPEVVRVKIVPCPLIEIASRDLRGRVAAGRSIRFLVPRAVEEFIRERKLYQSGSGTSGNG